MESREGRRRVVIPSHGRQGSKRNRKGEQKNRPSRGRVPKRRMVGRGDLQEEGRRGEKRKGVDERVTRRRARGDREGFFRRKRW